MSKGGSSSFGPGWAAWWRGDELHASFAKLVDKALRVMAYAVRAKARERIIRRGWGHTSKVKRSATGGVDIQLKEIRKYKEVWRKTKSVKTKKYRLKILNGKLLRLTRARYYRPSRPGQSPTNQRGVLRGSILYDFRNQQGLAEALIGPIAMQGSGSFSQVGTGRTSHWSMTDGLATHALEHGGWTRNHQGKMVRLAARPFMKPALDEVVREATVLRRAIENQLVVRGYAKSRPGIGWSKS